MVLDDTDKIAYTSTNQTDFRSPLSMLHKGKYE